MTALVVLTITLATSYPRLALAEANLQQAAELEESQYYRGQALEGQGRSAEARVAYEAALRVNPKYAPALHALGTLGSHFAHG